MRDLPELFGFPGLWNVAPLNAGGITYKLAKRMSTGVVLDRKKWRIWGNLG
jgi:hypothetical protein